MQKCVGLFVKKEKMIITYIANTIGILILLFGIIFCYLLSDDGATNDMSSTGSKRQIRNDDYNDNYYP